MDKKYLMIPMGLFAALCTATAGTVIEEGFESGAGSWSARGGETIAGSSTVAHTGTKSLKVSSRGNYWNGPALSSSKFVAGGTYDVESYVYFDGSTYSTSTGGGSAATGDIVSLKAAYANYFKIGTCLSSMEASKSQAKQLVQTHFNSVTPENELKPDAMLDQSASQSRGNNVNPQVRLGQGAKTILQYCSDNNIPLRGHCFVWHSQTPSWFFKENFSNNGADVSKEVMNQRMENYIKNTIEAVTSAYPKLNIYAWDVVNEAFKDQGGLRDGGDNNSQSGTSYWVKIYKSDEFIHNAFKYARKYAPKTCKLYYNDYNEYNDGKLESIAKIVESCFKEGNLDGVGMQSHLATNYPDKNRYRNAVKRFAQIGCDIQVTELDVTNSSESAQASYIKDLFDIYKEYKDNISAVVFWGTQDGMSWRSSQNPLIFNSQYKPKQAYYKIVDGMSVSSVPETPAESGSGLSECGFELCFQYSDGGETQYKTIGQATAKSKTWTKLSGNITIPSTATSIKLYIQTKDSGSDADLIDFYLDDVKCTSDETVVENPGEKDPGEQNPGVHQGGGSVNESGVYPISYSVENTGADCAEPSSLNKNNLKSCSTLPDPFEWADGSGRVTNFCDWSCRRNEIKREIEFWEIGEKPKFDKLEASYNGGTLTVKIYNGSNTLTLTSKISVPSGSGPHPIVIGMDGNTGSLSSNYFSKCIQVPFTHSQIAEYNSGFGGSRSQNDPFYKLYPGTFNTKADYCAWSWGISRLIDGLEIVKDQIKADLGHIAVTGCSYAGKMALFAGAFDERIALTIAQESGGGGINSWRVSEKIGSSVEGISNTNYDWFLTSFKNNFNGKTSQIPYDHHELIAMIAPRAFLAFGNPDYEWLGDESGYISLKGAEEVWKAMGIEDRFGYVIEGGHSHCQASSRQNSAAQAFIQKFLHGDKSQNTTIRTSTVNKDYQSWSKAFAGHKIINNGCGLTADFNTQAEEREGYGLEQNAPNPSTNETTITYSIGDDAQVSIVLYNEMGAEVMKIVNAHLEAGTYYTNVSTERLPSGIYHYVMSANGFTSSKSMIVK